MPTLFERIVAWLTRKAGSLLLILAVLLAVGWVRSEWEKLVQIQAEIERAESIRGGLVADVRRLDSDVLRLEAAWDAQTAATRRALESRLQQLDADLARQEANWGDALAKFASIEQRATDARRSADEARVHRDRLVAAARWWDPLLNPDRFTSLHSARARFTALDGVARAWEAARDKAAPVFIDSPVEHLKRERAQAAQQAAELMAQKSPEVGRLLEERSRKEHEVASAESLLDAQRRRISTNPGQRLLAAARAALPTALWILVGLMLVPPLVKTFLYYVLAPLASRLPPIRIIAAPHAPALPSARASAVSLPFEIGPGEEILVHSDFLQSSSQPAQKQTQWFLNPRLPFTSIASGMCILTRIRPEGGVGAHVVVSSQNDVFGEVGAIDLPEHSAMVVQPRSLAGVVKRIGVPLRISRHWRLTSAHAWLTLQLRYLAFHGPCTVVLKGCRGVRVEQPDAGRPRVINQAATLCFSANLDYRNTRCETFVSYLRGKEALFNDRFAGGPGVFVYEEMPAGGRRGGIVGRGLEGALDAALKAFGI